MDSLPPRALTNLTLASEKALSAWPYRTTSPWLLLSRWIKVRQLSAFNRICALMVSSMGLGASWGLQALNKHTEVLTIKKRNFEKLNVCILPLTGFGLYLCP